MAAFRTDVSIEPSPHFFDLKTPILTIGSCFAEAIGNRFDRFKFLTMINPFGAIYNPISIHEILLRSVDQRMPEPDSFVVSQGVQANYYVHSRFSRLSREELETDIQSQLGRTKTFLTNCERLVITYGTAFVHERKDNGKVVANCHKVSSSHFTKRLLEIDEIIESFHSLRRELHTFNRNLKIILTVSPVRHVKESLPMNSVSKSILRVACHKLVSDAVEYFPAYEIMMDDLRDYRFYKSDMIHPTTVAEEYIFEKFCEGHVNASTRAFMGEWQKVMSALEHRPFHPASDAHQQFVKGMLKKLQNFKDIDTAFEREALTKQLL